MYTRASMNHQKVMAEKQNTTHCDEDKDECSINGVSFKPLEGADEEFNRHNEVENLD